MNIVFCQHSGYGNLLLATPMLKAIRELFPKDKLIVLTWNRSIKVLEACPYIDVLTSVNNGSWIYDCLQFGNIDHLIVSPVGAIDFCIQELSYRTKNIHKIHIQTPWQKHESEVNMDFARKLGYNGETPKPELYLNKSNKIAGEDIIKKMEFKDYICINASYLKNDQWPNKHIGDKKYIEIIKALKNKYPKIQIILIGDDKEQYSNNFVIKLPNLNIINLAGFSDFRTTIPIIQNAILTINNEGFLGHCSAILGVPTIVCWTFTSSIKNSPIGIETYNIMVPCSERTYCQHDIRRLDNCKLRGCFDVSVKEVLDACDTIIARKFSKN